MLLVVFGAGASYDSDPDNPPDEDRVEVSRPPLAAQLFERRSAFSEALIRYAECKPIAHYLRPGTTGSLEETLQKLQEEGEKDPTRKNQIAAVRFYLQDIILECQRDWAPVISNYTTLVDQLRRSLSTLGPTICLVTFNYDRFLDNALGSVGVKIDNIADYIADDHFKLFKLHGSVNWARGVNRHVSDFTSFQNVRVVLIGEGATIELTDKYGISADRPIWKLGANLAVPAIAIPVQKGKTFECPNEHLECLRALLPSVSHLLTIGWRGAEQPFLDLLSTTIDKGIKGQVVSRSQKGAKKIADHLTDRGVIADFEAYDGGFTKFVGSRRAEAFLA